MHDFQFIPAAKEPGYSLEVRNYYADLGWNLPMLKWLDGLKAVLEGDAAKNMDLLLERLSGHAWSGKNKLLMPMIRMCQSRKNRGRGMDGSGPSARRRQWEVTQAPKRRHGYNNGMSSVYEITFLPEGRVRRFSKSRGNYYEFEDNSHLVMQTMAVWCHRCRRITDGERIDALDEIDTELANLDDPNSPLCRLLVLDSNDLASTDRLRLELIHMARKRRRWREGRRSHPKCIDCGSTEIADFPLDAPCSPNPVGPGIVQVTVIGICSPNLNEWFFTPEGDRIPKEIK